MTHRSTALAIVSVLALAGCGRLTSDSVVTGTPAGPHGGYVQVLMESDTVPEGFREIALVRARGEGNRANLESVMEGLQEEARSVGADAVVRTRIDQGSNSLSAIGTAGTLP